MFSVRTAANLNVGLGDAQNNCKTDMAGVSSCNKGVQFTNIDGYIEMKMPLFNVFIVEFNYRRKIYCLISVTIVMKTMLYR